MEKENNFIDSINHNITIKFDDAKQAKIIYDAVLLEFETSPDLAEYVANNLDLFDCQIGLVHSHNTFSAFFSLPFNRSR